MTILFEGARVILGDEVMETNVLVDDDLIVEIGSTTTADQIVDGTGKYLAPALVDVHGDAFERQIMPRPNVFFPVDAAILDTDRQLATNGIATAYHALTLGWEPGLRSIERAEAFYLALSKLTDRLSVENRLQLRWETFAFDAVGLIERMLDGALPPSIAFNDHTSMTMRSFDVELQERAFEQSETFLMANPDDPRLRVRVESTAKRAGMDVEAYLEQLKVLMRRRGEIDASIRKVAAMATERGLPMLSHDDTQVETRDYYRGLGAGIAEFPMNARVAQAARDAGDAIVFGAPNAVRGGSHLNSPSAGDMVEAGLCDILASDYFYPSLLAAVARLNDEKRAPLPDLWSLVSRGPAEASGLSDRGTIAVGKRADLVLIDWPDAAPPAIRMTMSKGRFAYRSEI